MSEILSLVARSNLYTMGVASVNDPRQAIPSQVIYPEEAIRVLRARLAVEEALEKCQALGVRIHYRGFTRPVEITMETVRFDARPDIRPSPKLIDAVVDACCDSVYVNIGTLCAMGVPDLPVLAEVCAKNDAKFPGGKALTNADGKYLKPEGWTPPDHLAVLAGLPVPVDMAQCSRAAIDLQLAKEVQNAGGNPGGV